MSHYSHLYFYRDFYRIFISSVPLSAENLYRRAFEGGTDDFDLSVPPTEKR